MESESVHYDNITAVVAVENNFKTAQRQMTYEKENDDNK